MPRSLLVVQRRAALAVFGLAAAWGAIGVIVRQVDLPAVAIVAARCWFAVLAIAAAYGVRRAVRGAPTPPVWPLPRVGLVVVLGLLLGVHWLCLAAAQQRAPIGTVLLLTYLAPVLVALLAPRVLGERVTQVTYVAVGLALLGTVLLARPEPGQGDGVALAVAAAITYAAITLLSKRVVGVVGGVRLGFGQLLVAGLALAPLAAGAPWGSLGADWWWLVLLGVVFTGVLGPLYLVLLDRLPASTVGVLTYVEPASAVLFAWVFLGEVPSLLTLAGGTLIVVAGIMVVRATTRPTTAEGARVRDRAVR
jgi:drug/metabolite transporter (DMT)-like permease